jgi:hypothetical protein
MSEIEDAGELLGNQHTITCANRPLKAHLKPD